MRKLLCAAALIAAGSAHAQPAPARLDAAAAQAIIQGCVSHSTARNQSHGIAVVDTGGHIVAALRMAGGYGIMDFAIAKARAAAAWGFSTVGMQEAVHGTPGFANAPYVVTVPGGVPVFSADGRTRIGAVGVSGEAPADDAACAEAGIAAAGLRAAPAPR